MKVTTKAKLKLAKMMGLKLASVETDKVALHYDGDVLNEGDEVFAVNADGDYILPEDGLYIGADGFVYDVQGGIVVSKKEKDQAADEDLEDNKDDKDAKDKKDLEGVEEDDVPDPETGETVSVEKFNELLGVVGDLVGEVVVLEDKLEETSSMLKTALKMSKVDFHKGKPAGNGSKKPSGEESRLESFLHGWKAEQE